MSAILGVAGLNTLAGTILFEEGFLNLNLFEVSQWEQQPYQFLILNKMSKKTSNGFVVPANKYKKCE